MNSFISEEIPEYFSDEGGFENHISSHKYFKDKLTFLD